MYRYFLILLIPFSLTYCISKQDSGGYSKNSPDSRANAVVNKAIDWAGGIEKWQNLSSISYTKRSQLLLENNLIEYDITQRHDYLLYPSLSMTIKWSNNGNLNQLLHSDTASLRFFNDSLIDKGEKVSESALSALYVLGMPFKLKDPGTRLSYEGREDFNGRPADVIRANYEPDVYGNHSTSDTWWYYFGIKDGAFLGCKVYHSPTYALIENVDFHDIEGLKLQKKRMSYRCDSLGNKLFKRAEFWYSDFIVSYKEKQTGNPSLPNP